MIPATFDYVRATTVQDAVRELAAGARPLAGGQSLLPLLKRRALRPGRLVDVERVTGLDGVRLDDGALEVGALVRLADLTRDPLVRSSCPALGDAAAAVADPQVRNRATLGGWLAHAAPHYDVGPVALVAEARLQVVSPTGERSVPADGLVVEPYRTSLDPAELITAVRLAVPSAGSGVAHAAVRRRRMDAALVVAAAWVELGSSGGASGSATEVTAARVAVSGAGLTPRRLGDVERALHGLSVADVPSVTEDADLTGLVLDGVPDGAGLVRRALQDALARALGRARGSAG